MQPANALHHRLSNPVEHDQTFLAIFDVLAWNDEHGRVELRHLHLILPLESANLLFPQPRIDLEERHACEVIGQLFSGIDEQRLYGASGTTLAKILHRKRPALIPLYDSQVGSCYQQGVDAPVPLVRGRRWDVFMPLFASAIQADLIEHMHLWTGICALAPNPPITALRALDIVAWWAGRPLPPAST